MSRRREKELVVSLRRWHAVRHPCREMPCPQRHSGVQRNLWAGMRNSHRPHCHAHAWTNWLGAYVPRQHGRANGAALAVSGVCHASTARWRLERKAAYKKILVPVHFSGCSREGLRYAIRFADPFGAKLVVLHVVSLPYLQQRAVWRLSAASARGRSAERRAAPNAKISTDHRTRWHKSSNSY